MWQKLRDQLGRTSLSSDGMVILFKKEMTEIFNGLSVTGDPVSDKDRVVHLIASKLATFIQYDSPSS